MVHPVVNVTEEQAAAVIEGLDQLERIRQWQMDWEGPASQYSTGAAIGQAEPALGWGPVQHQCTQGDWDTDSTLS